MKTFITAFIVLLHSLTTIFFITHCYKARCLDNIGLDFFDNYYKVYSNLFDFVIYSIFLIIYIILINNFSVKYNKVKNDYYNKYIMRDMNCTSTFDKELSEEDIYNC